MDRVHKTRRGRNKEISPPTYVPYPKSHSIIAKEKTILRYCVQKHAHYYGVMRGFSFSAYCATAHCPRLTAGIGRICNGCDRMGRVLPRPVRRGPYIPAAIIAATDTAHWTTIFALSKEEQANMADAVFIQWMND